jgi:hypothetical protein
MVQWRCGGVNFDEVRCGLLKNRGFKSYGTWQANIAWLQEIHYYGKKAWGVTASGRVYAFSSNDGDNSPGCLTLANNFIVYGTTCSYGDIYKFGVLAYGDYEFKMRSLRVPQYCLGIKPNSTESKNATYLGLSNCSDNYATTFELVYSGAAGPYQPPRIRHGGSGKCLEITGTRDS